MREIDVIAIEPLHPDAIVPLGHELRRLRTLADVLAWLRTLSPPRTVTEIITQDEYTHDVVAAYDEERWLAFDTN